MGRRFKIHRICQELGYSRQNYYKRLKYSKSRHYQKERAIRLLRQKRRLLPGSGVKKLYYQFRHEFKEMGIGRDRLLKIARESGLIKRKRRYYPTTQVDPNARKYPCLIKAGNPEALEPFNHILVADITYVRTLRDKYFLSLVADYRSRKIVGYCLKDSLSTEGPLDALKMALKQYRLKGSLLHHSDQGTQYSSKEYVSELKDKKYNATISMSRKGRPADNARMERINGILKTEFGLNRVFVNYEQLKRSVENAIEIYNKFRGHWSLNLKTPHEVFLALNSVN